MSPSPTPPLRPFEGFALAAQQHASATALEIGQAHWSYAALDSFSRRLATLLLQALQGAGVPPQGARVGVLASRSLAAYGGSLAVLATGAVLVALNPTYPVQRNAQILRRAGVQLLLVGEEGLEQLLPLAAAGALPDAVVAPLSLFGPWAKDLPVRQLLDSTDLASAAALAKPPPGQFPGDALAYVVFTSGSTGEPKGVAINHGNLAVYMHNFRALVPTLATDRVATTYELSFDVALHDMLNAWWSGAALVVMPERAMLAPARFLLEQRITVWFSVASFAMILQKQGLLRPGLFPLLRVSMLCGEALPMSTAMAWAQAAPHSVLYNVYGPTETTMELAFYRWRTGHSEAHCRRGVVPIGVPFDGHDHLLLDEQGQEVRGAGAGELYLSGPQVGPGYWADDARNACTFVALPGRSGRWYKTGDRVERDELGVYHFVSRVDFMVKVRGHRIELGDVEHALRQASGVDLVAVIVRPALAGMAQGLVAFVAAPTSEDGAAAAGLPSAASIRERLIGLLPKPMLPDEVHVLDQLPLNANRKVDRAALAALLAAA